MNDKLDVFEILSQKYTEPNERGQEQEAVPDPDFNEAIKQLIQPQQVQKDALPVKKKTKKNRSKNTEQRKLKTLLKVLIIIALVLLFFTFVVNVSKVIGDSMDPALENGDRVIINKLTRNYEKGDIIVFETGSGEKLVKRIIATDGDVINIEDGDGFLINGGEPEEEYIYTETAITDIRMSYPVVVDDNEYFVLGDNRVNSKDSRNADVGLVHEDKIIGKVIFCIRKF